MSPNRLLPLLVAVILAGLLALHAWHYWPYLSDDALIALRYAKRFASGQGLTWTDGERVEGYTNFLFVVLTGLVGKLVGFVTAARVLGILGVLSAIACIAFDPKTRTWSLPRLVVGGAFIVSTAPFAIWAIGGLEQGLLVGLLALSLRVLEVAAERPLEPRLWRYGVPLAALSLVRADGALLVAALLAGFACLPKPSLVSLRRTALVAIPSAVAVLLHFGFRLAYYGELMPNAARVKLAFTSERLARGLAYVGGGYASASMLLLVAVIATVFAFRRGERFRPLMPWAVVVSWTSYVAVVGGDPLPGYRQLVPLLLALSFLVADEVAADVETIVRQRVLVLPVLGLCIVLHATQGFETAENRRAKQELGAWDGEAVGQTLKTAFGSKRPLLAVDAAGALPFWSELPSLDMFGANDRHIARSRDGDAGYVLRRAPDLVAFNDAVGGNTPNFRAGRELVGMNEFQKSYQWITVRTRSDGRPVVGELWVRRERGKLGVTRSDDRITVPGYFFTGQASPARSSLDDRGLLVASLSARRPGILPELALPAGRFRIEIVPADPKLVLDVRCRGVSMQRGAPGGAPIIEVDGASPVTIALAPPFKGGRHRLQSVVLTRVAGEQATLRCMPAATPARVSAASLEQEKPAKTPWSHPANFVFANPGVVVELGPRQTLSWLEVSLSQNDTYLLELRRDGRVVWTGGVDRKARRNAESLKTHRFDLPKPVEAGTFELQVRPRTTAAPCSIGYVRGG